MTGEHTKHSAAGYTRKTLLTIVAGMTLMSLLEAAAQAEDGTLGPRVVAYYHSRVRSEYPCTQVDYSQMTHLAHAFVWPAKDGALGMPSNFLYPELVRAAHSHGVKIIVSVGGASKSGSFAAMADDAAARARFVQQLTGFCLTNHYDGADIDWETPTNATESANFTLLVHELRVAFNAANPPLTTLSAAVPKSPKRAKWLDFDAIKNDLDWLGVMGYAWHGTGSRHAGHNAPLYGSTQDPDGPDYCTAASIQYYLSRQMPKEKLFFGIPLYARQFNATNLYAASTGGDWIPYADVQQKLSNGWLRLWDSTAKVPYLLNPQHTQFVTYDDPQSIREKCEYVEQQHLGGVILWSLGQDLYQGQTPLLDAVGSNLLKRAAVVGQPNNEKPAHAEDASANLSVTQPADDEVRVGNNYVTLTVRKGAKGAVISYHLDEQEVKGPLLVATSGLNDVERAGAIQSFRMVESNPGKALLEVRAVGTPGKTVTVRYLVRKDTPVIEAQAGDGMGQLAVETRSRYAVVPDVFAGDLVVNPSALRQARLRLPSENVLAQLTDDGNGIVALAWHSSTQAVWLTLDGEGDNRAIIRTEIGCRKNLPVAVGMLAAPGSIWHRKKMADLDAVKDVKLDWKVPFRALWRADYQRDDGLIDSWKLVIRKSTNDWESFGISMQQPKSRTVYTSSRGTFAYPTCLDGDSAFLRRTHFEHLEGLKYGDDDFAIVYPLRTIKGSPATSRGVLDVLREALAGTPEEKLVDGLVVKRPERDHYPATCGVTEQNEDIFNDGKEQARKKFIIERLDAMNHFVVEIRSRIDEYRAWRKTTGEFLAAQKVAQPRIAGPADEFEAILVRFDSEYKDSKLAERTPAVVEKLSARVVALIDSTETNKLDEVKLIGRDTRTVGRSQDSTLCDYRMIAAELRQRAGYRMTEANDDAAFDFAQAVRERTLEMLRTGFEMEKVYTNPY